MDAHVFRRFCAVLTELLPTARLEKIQSPAADVHIFTFYAQQRKHILVLRHDRRNPLLFLSPERYSTGQAPPASTMRLRKYAAGRRVKDVRVDWPARRLHLCFQLAPEAVLEMAPAGAGPRRSPQYFSEHTCPELAGAEHFYVGNAPYIPPPETWISLDLRQGPELILGKAPDFGQEPLWPTLSDIAACVPALTLPMRGQEQTGGEIQGFTQIQSNDEGGDGPKQEHAPSPTADPSQTNGALPAAPLTQARAQAWEQWPVLTPALRRSLLHLDAPEQAALLADLEYGGGDIFVYSAAQNDTSAANDISAATANATDAASSGTSSISGTAASFGPQPSASSHLSATDLVAWPLPPALRGSRREQVYEDPVEALALVGTHMVLGGLERAEQHNAASPHKREAKRLTRVLEKLEREESRLRAMVAGKDKALYVQSVLWYFSPEARPAELVQALGQALGQTVEQSAATVGTGHGDFYDAAVACGEGAALPPCPFDPAQLQARLSLRENMEALFHEAARGQRGLAMLEQRRALLRGQVAGAKDAAFSAAFLPPQVEGRPRAGHGPTPPVGGAKGTAARQAGKQGQQGSTPVTVGQRMLPKNVEAFSSVDGLLILRGKDAKGNLALLKLGAPSDLWLHVEGGPGAHTLVRRASVGQEIPQATLEQAATLAAVKSWQKGNERVGVQCAEVRHVKPMRGAATGTVRIDKVACMVWVTMPPMSA